MPLAKWRKTKIQMVKTRVNQMQRGGRCVPGIRHMAMAVQACAHPVGSPQMPTFGVKECVAFSFEGGLPRRLPQQESSILEPASQMFLFSLPLWMGEA